MSGKKFYLFLAGLFILTVMIGGCDGEEKTEPAPVTTPEPAPVIYTLSVTVSPSGAGKVSPSGGNYEEGEEVKLTATATSGYAFDHWSGDAEGTSSTVTLTMDGGKSVTAHFNRYSGTLFEDDFIDNKNNWGVSEAVGEFIGLKTYLEPGAFHVIMESSGEVNGLTQTKVVKPASGFTHFTCELEVTRVGGSQNKACGLVFLAGSNKGDYFFLITGDSYYKLYIKTGEVTTEIIPLTGSSHINQGNESNNLMVICRDSIIHLYINNELVNSISGQFPTNTANNGIGLRADGPDTHIAFNHLKMWVPEEEETES